jgi:uncharacterized ferritin-like protein (DUF455 family)
MSTTQAGSASCRSLLAAALSSSEPADKVRLTLALARRVRDEQPDLSGVHEAAVVGRPVLPRLVHPTQVPRRRLGSRTGHAALVHAVAHIEFNAINLALDAAWRFEHMPAAYYHDWVSVAAQEATHFAMMNAHLAALDHAYGDFDAHDGLWQMAEQTAADVMVRMALVPRVLEARGLDVTPGMRARLDRIGDTRGVEILDVIARDEVGHVAIGTYWFRHACAKRRLDPDRTFQQLLCDNLPQLPRGPFALEARSRAGFSAGELEWLQSNGEPPG